MYPNYYGNQLNTIITNTESIHSDLQDINSNLESLVATSNAILFCVVLSITIAFIRKIFAVGR